VTIPFALAFRGSPQVRSGYNGRMDSLGSSNGIYLDHAATTEVDPAVLAVMDACYRENSGNPSSSHRAGLKAREELRTLAALYNDRFTALAGLGKAADAWYHPTTAS
jgi:selenocysteine lyase/cysteine desulfurase